MNTFIKDNWVKIVWIEVILVFPIYFLSNFLIAKYQQNNLAESTNEIVEEKLPTIKSSELPNAFEDYDIEKYGFLYMGVVGEDGKYTKVIVEGDEVESKISISYSYEKSSIKIRSDEDIDEILKSFLESEYSFENDKEMVNEQISKYGDIARNYLPGEKIVDYYESDVDNDGVKEKLITTCWVGANHCADRAEIVKGNNIIFSTELGTNSRGIRPYQGGFAVLWTDENSFIDEDGVEHGACCEASHNKTLFSFENGKFVPTKQWKVSHIWKEVVAD